MQTSLWDRLCLTFRALSTKVFQTLRRTLVGQLGVDPSAPVRQLHRRILTADPELDFVEARPSSIMSSSPSAGPLTASPTTGVTTNGPARLAGSKTQSRTGNPSHPGSRYQLPGDTRAFTGHRPELDRLVSLLSETPDVGGTGSVVISAIDGMGGVGETALGLHAAHRVRDAFPDGQLFIDLPGHSPGAAPLATGDALAWLLRSLGVSPDQTPEDQGERAALYRDRPDGTRTLIILDNAADTA
ncbi:MAG TPA: hypothetical protein VGX23_16580 [Actinocrinis sp.]|nr:hypothetical protein [Actinocrinis sp.]